MYTVEGALGRRGSCSCSPFEPPLHECNVLMAWRLNWHPPVRTANRKLVSDSFIGSSNNWPIWCRTQIHRYMALVQLLGGHREWMYWLCFCQSGIFHWSAGNNAPESYQTLTWWVCEANVSWLYGCQDNTALLTKRHLVWVDCRPWKPAGCHRILFVTLSHAVWCKCTLTTAADFS